jgi:hypothetical protein
MKVYDIETPHGRFCADVPESLLTFGINYGVKYGKGEQVSVSTREVDRDDYFRDEIVTTESAELFNGIIV